MLHKHGWLHNGHTTVSTGGCTTGRTGGDTTGITVGGTIRGKIEYKEWPYILKNLHVSHLTSLH